MIFDRRIVVERSTETVNVVGDRVDTWATLLTIWASSDYKGGKEEYESAEKTAIGERKFTVRYSAASSVTEKDRILYNSQYFDIRAINEIGRRDYLEFICDVRK